MTGFARPELLATTGCPSGWQYVSTNLWAKDCGETPEEMEGKVWW